MDLSGQWHFSRFQRLERMSPSADDDLRTLRERSIEKMAEREFSIGFDGGSTSTVTMLKGNMTHLALRLGSNAPCTIRTATSTVLQVGACSHCWYDGMLKEATGASFLTVKISNPAGVSCSFAPKGLEAIHVRAGRTEVLTYSYAADGTIRAKSKKAR